MRCRSSTIHAFFIVLLVTVAATARASADTPKENLSVYAGAGYLGSFGADGGTSFTAGVRWLLHPHLAASFDLGASSGYSSWSTYLAEPFNPAWAFQLVPTIRGHAIVAVTVAHDFDLFVRADVAQLVLLPGSRAEAHDAMWLGITVGSQFSLL